MEKRLQFFHARPKILGYTVERDELIEHGPRQREHRVAGVVCLEDLLPLLVELVDPIAHLAGFIVEPSALLLVCVTDHVDDDGARKNQYIILTAGYVYAVRVGKREPLL